MYFYVKFQNNKLVWFGNSKEIQSNNSIDFVSKVELYSFCHCIFKFLLSGSRAYYESRIYSSNTVREKLLQDMGSSSDNFIVSSKLFLTNMRDAIKQQNKFIDYFDIQPDLDEQNELKIGKNKNI